jgi:hypothetical protein
MARHLGFVVFIVIWSMDRIHDSTQFSLLNTSGDPIAPPPVQDPAGGERLQPLHSLPLPDSLPSSPPSVQVSPKFYPYIFLHFLVLIWYHRISVANK